MLPTPSTRTKESVGNLAHVDANHRCTVNLDTRFHDPHPHVLVVITNDYDGETSLVYDSYQFPRGGADILHDFDWTDAATGNVLPKPGMPPIMPPQLYVLCLDPDCWGCGATKRETEAHQFCVILLSNATFPVLKIMGGKANVLASLKSRTELHSDLHRFQRGLASRSRRNVYTRSQISIPEEYTTSYFADYSTRNSRSRGEGRPIPLLRTGGSKVEMHTFITVCQSGCICFVKVSDHLGSI
jgi:hypothetical protein